MSLSSQTQPKYPKYPQKTQHPTVSNYLSQQQTKVSHSLYQTILMGQSQHTLLTALIVLIKKFCLKNHSQWHTI